MIQENQFLTNAAVRRIFWKWHSMSPTSEFVREYSFISYTRILSYHNHCDRMLHAGSILKVSANSGGSLSTHASCPICLYTIGKMAFWKSKRLNYAHLLISHYNNPLFQIGLLWAFEGMHSNMLFSNKTSNNTIGGPTLGCFIWS